jgi:hypothetical protein
MGLSVLGVVTVLPLIGFLAMAAPEVGRLYLAGQTDAMRVAVAMASAGPALGLGLLSGLAYTLGALLLARALPTEMPRLLRLAFALQAPLLSVVALVSVVAELVGALCLLASGAWLVAWVWRGAAPEGERGPAVVRARTLP